MAPVHPHPDDDQPRQEADLLLQHAGQGGDRDEGEAGQGERVKPLGQVPKLTPKSGPRGT